MQGTILKILGFIVAPLLFLLYIAGELYLKLNKSSMCASSGCELAGALLKFDNIYLYYFGILAATTILILGILSYRKIIPEILFFIVLISSLLFESIMLGYQYYASPEMCVFCMGVYGFLWAILLLSSWKYFFMVIPAVIALLTALSFLAIPKSTSFLPKDGTYLLQSDSCKHCAKVKEYMNKNNIDFTKINIEQIEAQNFATFLNFTTIPILITKEGKNISIINGDKDIIESYETISGEITIEESVSIDTTFNAVKEEGCGFGGLQSLVQEEPESDCTKK
jgi:glutaredoxin